MIQPSIKIILYRVLGLAVLGLLYGQPANAYDFVHEKIYYNVLKNRSRILETGDTIYAVEVTYETRYGTNAYSGIVNIPDSVEYAGKKFDVLSIGSRAFQGSNVTSIFINERIDSIFSDAFFNCGHLKSIYIGTKVNYIGESAFANDFDLTDIHIKDIDAWCRIVFESKNSYTSNPLYPIISLFGFRHLYVDDELGSHEVGGEILIPNGISSISDFLFYDCSSITKVTLPESVTHFGRYAFSGCSSLTAINVPEGVTHIDYSALERCSSLEKIDLPNSLRIIDNGAFSKCTSLKSFVIPYKVTRIGKYAFHYDEGLDTLVIGKGVTTIDDYAFQFCSNLKVIRVNAVNPPYCSQSSPFDEETYTRTVLIVPSGCKEKYEKSDAWSNFTSIIEEDRELIAADNVTLALSRNNNTATIMSISDDIVVPSSVSFEDETYTVTAVGDSIFKDAVRCVEFPESITNISEKAFKGYDTYNCAIVWNSFTKLPPSLFDDDNYNKSNFLLYVKNRGIAPENVRNIIENGKAGDIELHDGYEFNCPQSFTADKISYTHNYRMATGYHECAGWESLALPFDVQTITHEKKGELVPFAIWDGGKERKPFWLYAPSDTVTEHSPLMLGGGWEDYAFVEASSINANTPYIISFPYNDKYSSQYNLNGNITFEAEDAVVKTTTGYLHESLMRRSTSLGGGGVVTHTSRWFVPSFRFYSKQEGFYALNVDNDFFTNESDEDKPGSVFIKSYKTITPFEAYVKYTKNVNGYDIIDPIILVDSTKNVESRKIPIVIVDNEMSGIKELLQEPQNARTFSIYDIHGVLIRSDRNSALDNILKTLSSGIYIIGGKKIVVK